MNRLIDLEKLIYFSIKAPSGHNTQPWLFSTGTNEIQIYPNFTRALPVVDNDNHALYISLGCATENIVLAASHYGYGSDVRISESENGVSFIKIFITLDESNKEANLFKYINERQSTRNEYSKKKVPPEDLHALKQSFNFKGINVKMLTSPGEFTTFEPLIIEGSNLQFQNKKFVGELVDWFRFSKKEAKKKGDGLWGGCMGFPNMKRFVGKVIMKYLVSAKSEAKRWNKLIDASAGFALFVADKNDVEHWVRLGRAFQRFGLTATKLGISHAHMNMPCEEMEVRKKLISLMNLGAKHPLLLLRLGYSEKLPYSLRRNIEDVIIKEEKAING